MNPAMLHRINSIESEMDAEHDMLEQCAASGQLDSRQIAAHASAGELDLRHVASEPIYTDSDYRNAGHESAGTWYDEPAPEIASTTEAVVNGIAALLAIGFFFGGCVWLIVTLKPLVAAFH